MPPASGSPDSAGAPRPPDALTGLRVALHPVAGEHVEELIRIRRTSRVHQRWGEVDAEPGWPFDDPEIIIYTVLADGRVIGLIQYGEETTPAYRHASIDIFLDPRVHGQGLGRDAVHTLARHLIDDLGHHRLVIDPAADNLAAIRCYAAIGFRPVGVMRRYEQDPDGLGWHDGLLMDLLAGELVRPP